jgi:hypothetical protein
LKGVGQKVDVILVGYHKDVDIIDIERHSEHWSSPMQPLEMPFLGGLAEYVV